MKKENVKESIAKNLAALRRAHGLTQQELAEKLSYSDKAVSRWERAEALPDIETLSAICDIYGVSFEYLLRKEEDNVVAHSCEGRRYKARGTVCALIAICAVWFLATAAYAFASAVWEKNLWSLFVWALPMSCIALYVFCCALKCGRVYRLLTVSGILWTLILSIYLELLLAGSNVWVIFIVGAPVQALILLVSMLKKERISL